MLSAWDIAVPFTVLGAICALTPGAFAIVAVTPLREQVDGAVRALITGTVVSYGFAFVFMLLVPYRDLPSSAGSVIGITMAVCLGMSAITMLFITITTAESEDRSLTDWDD